MTIEKIKEIYKGNPTVLCANNSERKVKIDSSSISEFFGNDFIANSITNKEQSIFLRCDISGGKTLYAPIITTKKNQSLLNRKDNPLPNKESDGWEQLKYWLWVKDKKVIIEMKNDKGRIKYKALEDGKPIPFSCSNLELAKSFLSK